MVHFTGHKHSSTPPDGTAAFEPIAPNHLLGLGTLLAQLGHVAAASWRNRRLRLEIVLESGAVAVRICPRGAEPALAQSRLYGLGYEATGDENHDRQAAALVRRCARLADQPELAEALRLAMGGFDASAFAGACDVYFSLVGQLSTFLLANCDGTARQAPRRWGPQHLVLLGDGAAQVWGVAAPLTAASALTYSKNLCGIAHLQTAAGLVALRLTPKCAQCDTRFACAGCFEQDLAPAPVVSPPRRQGCDVEIAPADVFDLAGRRKLAHAIKQLPAGGRVFIAGRAPTAVLGADPTAAEAINVAEPATVAAALRNTRLKLVDCVLPGRHGSSLWQLVYALDGTPLPAPTHLTIVANRKCVTVCRYCNLPLRLLNNMALHDVMALLEEVAVLGTQHIEFFGGEVTLRRDLPLVLAYARHLGLACDVTTTGVGPDDALLRLLAQAGIADLSVSLDSADPAVHDYLKNREGIHAAAVHAAKTLVQAGAPWVGVNTVVTRINFRGLPDLLNLVADLGLRGATFFLCQPIAEIGHATDLLHSDEVAELLQTILPRCHAIAADRGLKLAMRPPIDRETADPLQTAPRIASGIYNALFTQAEPCRVVDRLVSVHPSGDVRLCNQPIWQFEPEAVVGNVNSDALPTILQSAAAAAFRAQAGHWPQCRYCSFDHAGEQA